MNPESVHPPALGTYVEDCLSFISRTQLHSGVRHTNVSALAALPLIIHLSQFVLSILGFLFGRSVDTKGVDLHIVCCGSSYELLEWSEKEGKDSWF